MFSDVSSYGLDNDEFEFFDTHGGTSNSQWETRINETYGARYRGKLFEETQESGIRIGAFPVAFSYPFGPRRERIGLYNEHNEREVVTFISQIKVDSEDSSLNNPNKFIGRAFSREDSKIYSGKYDWVIKEQEPELFRRVVPSPKPLYIFNGKSIKHLVEFSD